MAKKVRIKKEKEPVEAPVVLRPDVDQAVEKRLVALYTLQSVDSEIDKIQIVRGELPQAVQDLEDEIAGLSTRIENFTNEIKETENANKQTYFIPSESAFEDDVQEGSWTHDYITTTVTTDIKNIAVFSVVTSITRNKNNKPP